MLMMNLKLPWQKKSDKNLIITTGFNLPNIIKKIKPKLDGLKVNLYEGLDFTELKKITINSNTLISCHGAISHVAAAKNIKQIDIIDKSYNYSKWTSHFRNYNFLYRDKFYKLSNEIIHLLWNFWKNITILKTFVTNRLKKLWNFLTSAILKLLLKLEQREEKQNFFL